MTQKELIIAYVREHGSIVPAKMSGELFHGQMMGSEVSKRCRELRAGGFLLSKQEGRFERFWLKPIIQLIQLPPPFKEKKITQEQLL